jgi:hypothetical protein
LTLCSSCHFVPMQHFAPHRNGIMSCWRSFCTQTTTCFAQHYNEMSCVRIFLCIGIIVTTS